VPAIFYLHPWELDPEQPRLNARLASRLRHYRNLDKTEHRLQRLLREFRFGTIADVLASRKVDAGLAVVPVEIASGSTNLGPGSVVGVRTERTFANCPRQ
jgi:hypothetical protein